MLKLIIVGIIVFCLNLPFGYWRAKTKKLSLKWFLAIHIPVGIEIILRIVTDLGWGFITYLVLVGSFILGQFIGGKLSNKH